MGRHHGVANHLMGRKGLEYCIMDALIPWEVESLGYLGVGRTYDASTNTIIVSSALPHPLTPVIHSQHQYRRRPHAHLFLPPQRFLRPPLHLLPLLLAALPHLTSRHPPLARTRAQVPPLSPPTVQLPSPSTLSSTLPPFPQPLRLILAPPVPEPAVQPQPPLTTTPIPEPLILQPCHIPPTPIFIPTCLAPQSPAHIRPSKPPTPIPSLLPPRALPHRRSTHVRPPHSNAAIPEPNPRIRTIRIRTPPTPRTSRPLEPTPPESNTQTLRQIRQPLPFPHYYPFGIDSLETDFRRGVVSRFGV